MRTVRPTPTTLTTALALTAGLAGATGLAAGRLAADAALKAPPGRPLPTESRLTVHATAAGRITLTRALASRRPGTYGLTGHGSHAVVGQVLTGTPHSADTVVRRLERVTHGTLETGDRVRLTPNLHIGDPGTALGLDHTDVDVPGELGPLPAWFVPGVRDMWVIAVHGLGATREHPMNLMRFYNRNHLTVLALSHRGDAGAPRSPDGLHHLGDTEWRDVDAAIQYAVRHGARQVVLHGWSTGATMALIAAVRSELRDRVVGLVLDSPVLDREATVRALAAARHTPRVLLPLAVRAAQGKARWDAERLRRVVDPGRLTKPTLLFHGPGDAVAPWGASRRLAEAKEGLVVLHEVREGVHGAMWNADPEGYEEALGRFLTPLV
ncbi:alpha/beta hydrolase [Streptomyces sp. NBC_00670]|uniref:alpha/beta hydrolase n=1 Tax=Streptomyces sp. NBC_00670 TaxID=2975804 RepID=UPI002E3729E0|nr:alpha/beta fold hydrolase [Streptomyces sp. NBC_00670]